MPPPPPVRDDAAGKKILVVDDDEWTRILITEILASYLVTSTGDPFDAVKLIATEKFSLVISDYKMPGLDGINLFRVLKENFGKQLPFTYFLISGHPEELLTKNPESIGINAIFMKPIDAKLLKDSVDQVFAQKWAGFATGQQ